MSDLIERQAAIDIVSGYAEQLNGYIGSPNDSEVYAYARGLILSIERNINAVRPVQPTYTDTHDMEQAQLDKAFELGREDAKPQWIPCSERLPEHSGWYIVTKKLTDDGDKAVCLSWYSFHGWEWGENPIAWMPLPEPYREEGGQDETN